jgi:hypothetical protein
MDVLGIVLFGSALIGYTGWVTALVVRSSALEKRQKVFQVAIAWLVPVLGAIFVHLINRAQDQGPTALRMRGVEPQLDQGVSPADFPDHG